MHKMIVLAKALPGQTEALGQWYDETHIADLLAVDGLVSAERHKIVPLKGPEGLPAWDFMLVYELAGDPFAVLGNMAAANVPLSDIMESSQTLSLVAMSQGLRHEG